MEEITNISEYYPVIIGFLVSVIIGLISFTINRIINSNEKTKNHLLKFKESVTGEFDKVDARLDLLELQVSTNHRDLELLRKEHDRELDRCHGLDRRKNQEVIIEERRK